MTTATRSKTKPKSKRPTPEEKLVEEIINLMETGTQPWRKEWN